MLIRLLKAKIHRATVTFTDVNYHGSITIDVNLLRASGLLPNEAVLVADCGNGNRFETYIIPGEAGSGIIGINGAAARLTRVGNKVIVMAFAPLGHGLEPSVLADPVITGIARRIGKTPAQVALAWAVQRGTAALTTSTKPDRIRENFDIAALPDDAMEEMRTGIATNVRFNQVVGTGVPGFIPGTR